MGKHVLLMVACWLSLQVQAGEETAAISIGARSCQSLVGSSQHAPTALGEATTWTEGYLSAQHAEWPDWAQFVEGALSRNQREKFIHAYCRRFPAHRVLDAAREVLDFLETSKGGHPRNL
ncbi:hypothetical protein B6S59_04660 [Pseudomonas sp. A46]|nr:hypothetical protein B6S59_04660 [Pseudomonas sp. A46]